MIFRNRKSIKQLIKANHVLADTVAELLSRINGLKEQVTAQNRVMGHMVGLQIGLSALALEDKVPQLMSALETQRDYAESDEQREALDHLIRIIPQATDLKTVMDLERVELH